MDSVFRSSKRFFLLLRCMSSYETFKKKKKNEQLGNVQEIDEFFTLL